MKIRKKMTVESAHVVKNCFSERCKYSIHGHSAVIEVILKGDQLDNAGMLMDFNVMNVIAKPIVDMMDHCTMVWLKDDKDYIESILNYSDRVLLFNFNPSAENLSTWLHVTIDNALQNVVFANGEGYIQVDSIKYHETTTGYAESEYSDIYDKNGNYRQDIVKKFNSFGVTQAVYNDLPETTVNILQNKPFIMKTPEQQVIND